MSTKTQNILRYTLLGGIFLAPFIPLIVANDMFFPFITGKNFTFRILVEVLLGVWAVLAYFNAEYRPKMSFILASSALLVGVIAIADFFGENPFKSIWSNYERMEGLVGLLHLFAYFIVSVSVLRTERLWERFFAVSIGVSVLMGIYGLLQLNGTFEINQGGVRVDGTFGNAAYLAVYNLFHIFLAAFLLLRRWGRNVALSVFYGGAIVLNLVMLYLTATRGAILGLLGGVMLSALLIALFEKERKNFRKTAVGMLAGAVLLVGGFLAVKNTSFVKESPVLSRFASISLNETTTKARFMVWEMAWKGFKERPLLGWGQENFNYVFNKYYNPKMYGQEPWFDRAHNVFFDWLIAGGVLGLVSYLLLFASGLYVLWVRIASLSVAGKSILTGLFAGYFFNNLFVFDNLMSSVMFFSLLGYIHTAGVHEGRLALVSRKIAARIKKMFSGGTLDVVVAPLAVVSVVFTLYFFNYHPLQTNFALLEALKPHAPEDGGLDANLAYFKEALARKTMGTQEVREQLVQVATTLLSMPNIPGDVKNRFVALAESEAQKQIEDAPNDARAYLFYATILEKTGRYDEAIAAYQKALLLSPHKQAIYFGMVGAYLNKGDYQKAFEAARTAFELAPEYNEARKIYALAAMYTGDNKLAEELLVPVFGTTEIDDNRFIQTYMKTGQYQKAIAIWKRRIEKDPQNSQYRLALAGAYLAAGDRSAAIREIEKLIELSPEFKEQGEYYIKEIRAGRNP